MKKILVIAIVSLLFQGCKSKFEIPNGHAAVVKSNEQLEIQVLKPGEHSVSWSSEVIIYNISQVTSEIEFEFLFKNVSEGKLNVIVEFKPIVDSLSGFYRKFESRYIAPVVDSETRRIVRNLLEDYNPNELTKEELEFKIVKAITENNEIINYVNVNKVDIVELKF